MEGVWRGWGGRGWERGKEGGWGRRERERGMLFMRFVLLASLWLSQRPGHCCVYYRTVLRTLILPLLAPCHFHKSKTAPKCRTTQHRSIK